MANSILDSQYASPNALLTTHGFPVNTSGNALLLSHSPAGVYPNPGGGGFSAVLNAGTGELVITGVGFGTKSGPAPLFFQPFVGLTNGLLPTHASVGFDWGNDGAGYPQTYDGDGVGGGCLTIPADGISPVDPDCFFDLGVDLNGNHAELFVSQWQKLSYNAGTVATGVQVKGVRAGRLNPSDPTAAGSYAYNPSMGGSIDIQPDGSQTTNANNCYQWFRETGHVGIPFGNFDQSHNPETAPYRTPNTSVGSPPYPRVTTGWGQWFQQEVYFKMNTYGATDGIQILKGNNQQLVHLTHADPRQSSDADNAFQQVNVWPGVDGIAGADLTLRISRVYIDNTRKRVFLGNASTLGACTGSFLLPPTEWADTLIKCSNCTNIPSGYDWVYVLDENDAEIASGART
jgi:hypothetical protein